MGVTRGEGLELGKRGTLGGDRRHNCSHGPRGTTRRQTRRIIRRIQGWKPVSLEEVRPSGGATKWTI